MMFGGMCGGWKAKKSYEKYRKELEESPRTRRRLLQANIGVDDSDAENVDDFVHHDPLTTEILLDFAPVSDTEGRELAVKKGDIVRVLYRTGEWLYVSKKLGSEGYVPAGYCRAYAAPAVIEQFDEEKKRLRQQTATNAAKSGPKPKKFEKGDRVEALYNFRAEERDDLSISRGDRLVVVDEQDHDWVWVRNGAGNEGCVPATYVVSCGPPPPPPRVKIDRPVTADRDNDDVRNLLTNVKAKLQTVDPSRRHFPHKQLPHQNYHQRSRSVEDTRARGKSPTPQPTDDRPQQQQQQPTRRFPPKLQPSNLAPISESGARRNGSPAPTSGGGARRPKQQFHSMRLAESGGYLNRSHSFSTVATAPPPSSYRATRRHLETRLLESSALRPSDFSFDNINQLLNVADGKRPTTATGTLNAKLYEHRDGSGSAAASSSNPSPTHSTISADSSGACSTTSRKLDYNRMQIEARLRLSHSRLGIHSSQTSIPIVSTTTPVASQRLHVQREQDNSWSYSTP